MYEIFKINHWLCNRWLFKNLGLQEGHPILKKNMFNVVSFREYRPLSFTVFVPERQWHCVGDTSVYPLDITANCAQMCRNNTWLYNDAFFTQEHSIYLRKDQKSCVAVRSSKVRTFCVHFGEMCHLPINPNPIGLFWGLESIGGGGGILAPPQISATNGPIDLKIGTVVKQVK